MSPRCHSMNIVLIGYRGTGKSIVARLLAERLGWAWVDADQCLQERAGRTIREIFDSGGEPLFRDLEEAVIGDLSERDGTVIAAGGGAVLREANREALRRRGKLVWLRADADTILRRLEHDVETAALRPNLTIDGGRAEIEQLLAVREPIYRECADLTVETAGREPGEVADEIVQRLGLNRERTPET